MAFVSVPIAILVPVIVAAMMLAAMVALVSVHIVHPFSFKGGVRATADLSVANGAPPQETGLSVCIMNWERTEHVKAIVAQYATYNCVREIIIWNSNPKEREALAELDELDKVYTLHLGGKDLGLTARFAAASMTTVRDGETPEEATGDAVWIQDDDLLWSETGMEQLFQAQQAEPDVVHGIWGRMPTQAETYSVNEPPASITNAAIILTKTLVCSKWHVAQFWRISAHLEDFFRSVKPRANGEDIAFSLAALAAQHGKLHKVHPHLKKHVKELPQEHESINRRVNNHLALRKALVKQLAKQLQIILPKNIQHYKNNTATNRTTTQNTWIQ